ncbi:MAG: hypothetical protein ACLFWL_19255 [Candidatus Brocadiia bacterium]
MEGFRRASWAFIFFLPLDVPIGLLLPECSVRNLPLLPNFVGWLILGMAMRMFATPLVKRLRFLQILGCVLSLVFFSANFWLGTAPSATLSYVVSISIFLEGAASILFVWHLCGLAIIELRKKEDADLISTLQILRVFYPVWIFFALGSALSFWHVIFALFAVGALAIKSITLILLALVMRQVANQFG